ncbi:S-layer homology domain-containing protein [Peptococcus simiae]|uniref:S-layer homology domain-containing protein n=1 Tax=Peptococcus simiae TaxID=1643805 RepID=A0ABW9H1L7_9FIRM
MKKKKICAGVLAASLLVSSFPVTVLAHPAQAADQAAVQMKYGDIKGHKHEKLLQRWIEEGKLKGDDHGQVNPNASITRAELASFINRVKGYTEMADISHFKDVNPNDWYAQEIARAVKAGYLVGMGPDTFGPNGPVTTEQAVAVALRLSAVPNQSLKDVQVPEDIKASPWAKEAIRQAIANGIFTLTEVQAGLVQPEKRANNILILDRALNKNIALSVPGTYTLGSVNDVDVQTTGITLKDGEVKGILTVTAKKDAGQEAPVSLQLEKVKLANKVIAPSSVKVTQDGTRLTTQEPVDKAKDDDKKSKGTVTIGGSSGHSSGSSKPKEETNKPKKPQAETYNELPRIMDWLLNRPITNTDLEKAFKEFPKGAKITDPVSYQFTKPGTQTVTATLVFADKSTKKQDITINVKEKLDDYSGLTVKPIAEIKALDNDRGYVDGVYDGFALGYQKNLYVKVTVKGGKIVAVDKAGDGQIDDGGTYEEKGFKNLIKTVIDKQDPQSLAAQLNAKLNLTKAMYNRAGEKGHTDEAYKEAMKHFFGTEEGAPRGMDEIYQSHIQAYDAIGKKVRTKLKAAGYERIDVASGATWTAHGTANAIIDALNKANPKNDVLGMDIKGDRVQFDRHAGKDKASGYNTGDPLNFKDFSVVLKKRGGKTETIQGADFAKKGIRVERKNDGKEVSDGMALTEENVGNVLGRGLQLNLVHVSSGVKKELLVLISETQKLKQKEFQYRIVGTEQWENLYTPKEGFDAFKFVMPVPKSKFDKIVGKKIEVRVILTDKNGQDYILQGTPDKAFEVPDTSQKAVGIVYGKDALQTDKRKHFDYYDTYTYMFKAISDNAGEAGKMSAEQEALKAEIDKVEAWFAGEKFSGPFDKDKREPLKKALDQAKKVLADDHSGLAELQAEKEALAEAAEVFKRKMLGAALDVIDMWQEELDDEENQDQDFKQEIKVVQQKVKEAQEATTFNPMALQLAFYNSDKLLARSNMKKDLPHAEEVLATHPSHKRLKSAIDAAKAALADSRKNREELQAASSELSAAISEAEAEPEEEAKKPNSNYPAIAPTDILNGGETVVTLPTEVETRTVVGSEVKMGEKVLKPDQYALDLANHTLTLKNLTEADAGQYTLSIQSNEYEDLNLPFELKVGKKINYTVQGMAHVKKLKSWKKKADSYYVIATVTFNDKHEVVAYDLAPASANKDVDPLNENGIATLDQVTAYTFDIVENRKEYEASFAGNQEYWDPMIYGDPKDPEIKSFDEIIKAKNIKTKADFQSMKTEFDDEDRTDKNVDTTSGATISSNAAKNAILDAFDRFEAQFK